MNASGKPNVIFGEVKLDPNKFAEPWKGHGTLRLKSFSLNWKQKNPVKRIALAFRLLRLFFGENRIFEHF